MQVFPGHTGPVQCGDFTPDGKRIITADAEGNLIFWDPRSPTPVFKLGPTDARFDVESITSLAVIGGVQAATGTSTAGASKSSSTAAPGLQTGAAGPSRGHVKGAMAIVGGAIGFAYML